MLDSSDCSWKCATAMGERDAKFRKPLEHAAENHRTNRERCFRRHADEPRQPVFRHPFFTHHVPWMNEDRSVELFRRFPDNIERRMIQVPAIGSVAMIVRIDMGSDLNSAQTQVLNAALKFLRRKIRILHWEGAQPGEARWMIANDFGDMIVQEPREIESVL